MFFSFCTHLRNNNCIRAALLLLTFACGLFMGCAEEDIRLYSLQTPVSQCGIKTVNGVPYEPGMKIEPLDDVVLTAFGSKTTRNGVDLTKYYWEKTKEPLGSTAKLSTPNKAETRLVFSNDVYGLDLAGHYEVKLTVEDSSGSRSNNACTVQITAIPSALLHIQLVWDTEYGDMDLHLSKQNSRGQFCVDSLNDNGVAGPIGQICPLPEFAECNYANCRKYHDQNRPNWDKNVAFESLGDPTLDIDDLAGLGPENINIEQASGGEFLVSVHHFGGSKSAGNTVRLYLYGRLYAEYFRVLDSSEWWEVAKIHWPEDMSAYPCVEDLQTNKVDCLTPQVFQMSKERQAKSFGCLEASDCGANTKCDFKTGRCLSTLNLCAADNDCPIQKRCNVSQRKCVIPECENNRQCKAKDMSLRCDLKTFRCTLPQVF